MFTSFITPAQLVEIQACIVDCRFSIVDTELGYHNYQNQHIPRAIYAHLDDNLSSPIRVGTGRHPLPDIQTFTQWVAKSGIDPSKQIVVYDDIGGGIAARLWFLLTQLGFPTVAILEGGFPAWLSSGYPLSSGVETLKPVPPISQNSWNDGPYQLMSTDQVHDLIGPDIIDSRSEERHKGENETLDFLAGRIPGSSNIYWASNLDESMHLKPIEELKVKFDLNQVDKVYHCGSGVTACLNLAIIRYLGLDNPALYPGSWSEWIRHYPNLVETGE